MDAQNEERRNPALGAGACAGGDGPSIRRATESDIPELSRLVAALASWEEALDPRARFDWDGIRDAPNWLKLVLNREHHAIWVATLDGRLVGHLWARLKRQADGAIPQSLATPQHDAGTHCDCLR